MTLRYCQLLATLRLHNLFTHALGSIPRSNFGSGQAKQLQKALVKSIEGPSYKQSATGQKCKKLSRDSLGSWRVCQVVLPSIQLLQILAQTHRKRVETIWALAALSSLSSTDFSA